MYFNLKAKFLKDNSSPHEIKYINKVLVSFANGSYILKLKCEDSALLLYCFQTGFP